MRLDCPLCGPRDLREFTPKGAATYASRPEGETWSEAWDAYLHLRDNLPGRSEELWYHGAGCTAWLIVDRDTASHEVLSVRLAGQGAR